MFFFTEQAKKQFLSLDKSIQIQIRKKLEKINHGEGYALKPIANLPPYTHRLRVGNYRLLIKASDDGYDVLKVGHRSTIYT